jgi:hypothetical protein
MFYKNYIKLTGRVLKKLFSMRKKRNNLLHIIKIYNKALGCYRFKIYEKITYTSELKIFMF